MMMLMLIAPFVPYCYQVVTSQLLLVGGTGVHGKNNCLTSSHWQLSHMPQPGSEPVIDDSNGDDDQIEKDEEQVLMNIYIVRDGDDDDKNGDDDGY